MRLSPIASAVTVELDKPRTLILDFNAFAAFYEVTRQELPDVLAGIFERDENGQTVKDEQGAPKVARALTSGQMRAIVWAGVAHEADAPNMKTVGRYMSTKNQNQLMVAVFQSVYGIEAAEEADPIEAPAAENASLSAGTGTESTPSVDSN